MQLKYITALFASMAVQGVLAAPTANTPVGLEAREAKKSKGMKDGFGDRDGDRGRDRDDFGFRDWDDKRLKARDDKDEWREWANRNGDSLRNRIDEWIDNDKKIKKRQGNDYRPERPDRYGDDGPERPDRYDDGPERPDRYDDGPERPDRYGDGSDRHDGPDHDDGPRGKKGGKGGPGGDGPGRDD